MTGSAVWIDLILLAIIGVSVFISAKRGFVSTVIGTVGFFLAIVLSLTICTPIANTVYDKMIEPPIVATMTDEVERNFKENLEDTLGENYDPEKLDEVQEQINASSGEIIEALPDFIQNYIKQSGLNADELLESAGEVINAEDTVKTAAEKVAFNFSQTKIKPMAASIISTVLSVILFIVFLIIFKILGHLLNKLFSFSVVGKINTVLGGVCGLVKGIVFSIIFCVVIYAVVSFTENGIWIFNFENFEHTMIFKLLISLIKI